MINLPKAIKNFRVYAQSGLAFTLEKGETIRIIDVEGEQVADLFCFAKEELEEALSSGHTTDYNNKIFLSEGDILYSNRSNPMFTIITDQVGRNMMLYAPCSQVMFEKTYDVTEAHPNCLDNLHGNLKEYGVQKAQITVPFNIFMNIEISPEGEITIRPPISKEGNYIELRAEMDLVVGLTSCSAGLCNNFKWTPIDVEIYAQK